MRLHSKNRPARLVTGIVAEDFDEATLPLSVAGQDGVRVVARVDAVYMGAAGSFTIRSGFTQLSQVFKLAAAGTVRVGVEYESSDGESLNVLFALESTATEDVPLEVNFRSKMFSETPGAPSGPPQQGIQFTETSPTPIVHEIVQGGELLSPVWPINNEIITAGGNLQNFPGMQTPGSPRMLAAFSTNSESEALPLYLPGTGIVGIYLSLVSGKLEAYVDQFPESIIPIGGDVVSLGEEYLETNREYLDLVDAGTRQAIVDFCMSRMFQFGPGVLLSFDNCTIDYGGSEHPVAYTAAEWEHAQETLVLQLIAAAHSVGRKVWLNLAHPIVPTAVWARLASYGLDAVLDEGPAYLAATAHGVLAAQIDNYAIGGQDFMRGVIVPDQTDETERMILGMLLMAKAADGDALYMIPRTSAANWWFADLPYKLGVATAGYTSPGSQQFTRVYTAGTVKLDMRAGQRTLEIDDGGGYESIQTWAATQGGLF